MIRKAWVLATCLSTLAYGHAALVSPTPRSTSSGIKVGPCGPDARTNNPTVFAPGTVITVTWKETIAHPGYYRIAYSLGTDTDFDSHVLLNNIANPAGTQATQSAQVTLPNISCPACTLQLIQVMT